MSSVSNSLPSQDPVQVLAHHGKSFYWAGKFLPKSIFSEAAVVYAYCRRLDDHIDENPQVSIFEKMKWLECEKIQLQKQSSLLQIRDTDLQQNHTHPHSHPSSTVMNQSDSLLLQFVLLQSSSSLGLNPCYELMDGMMKDLSEVRISTVPELLQYCYQVAGTVGLLMCPVLKIDDNRAFPFAVDLGISMQLYNICRDVAVDAKMGRIYLPASLCQKFELSHDDLLLDGQGQIAKIKPVIQQLLSLADRYYESGMKGLIFIPWYARWGIAVAATVYRGIGIALKAQKFNPYVQRAYTYLGLKMVLTAKAFLIFIQTLFQTKDLHVDHDSVLHEPLIGKPGCDDPEKLHLHFQKRGKF